MRLSELSAVPPGSLADPGALGERYRRDGCLLLRQAIDPSALRAVADQAAAALERCGVARRDGGLRWTGAAVPHPDETGIDDIPEIDELVRLIDDRADPFRPVTDHVFGVRTRIWRGLYLFVSVPDDAAYVSPPHQDNFAVSPLGDYRRMWFPLTEIAFGDGGLGVAIGSHLRGRLPREPLPGFAGRPRRGDTGPARQSTGIDPATVDDHWHTAAMRPGDLLLFHPHLVHRGLPAAGDRIRLALAGIVSAAADPVPPVMHSSREYRERLRRIRQLAAPFGLSEQQIFELAANINRAGEEIDERTVGAAALRVVLPGSPGRLGSTPGTAR